MRKLTERIANLTKKTKAIVAVIVSAIIVAGTGIGFVNANEIHVAPTAPKVKTDVVATAITGEAAAYLGTETVADAKKADKADKATNTKEKAAETDKGKAAEEKKAEKAETKKSEKKSTEKAKTEQKATANTASGKKNNTTAPAAAKPAENTAKPAANTAKPETSKPAAHVHSWVERYDNVMVQAAYDEPIYENQPVYETRPVYGNVTKYRNTTKCSCGAIGVSYEGIEYTEHATHGLMAYQEPYTETVQTGTKQVQVGTTTVQTGTKHHDAVYQRQVVGYSCACGATK